jgi:hypothetical protein
MRIRPYISSVCMRRSMTAFFSAPESTVVGTRCPWYSAWPGPGLGTTWLGMAGGGGAAAGGGATGTGCTGCTGCRGGLGGEVS